MTGAKPTYVIPSSFMRIPLRDGVETEYCVCGIPFDLGTSNRPGTRFGPSAIRAASRMLLAGDHPFHWIDPIDQDLADVGDLEMVSGDIPATIDIIEKQAVLYKHLITLGGDHTISLPLLRAVAKKHGTVGLLHFDAHVDTWPDTADKPLYYHGNPFWHAINEGLVDPQRMVQIGIRSPVKQSVYDWTIQKGVTIITAAEALTPLTPFAVYHNLALEIEEIIGTGPVYLTIDIDVLDPAFAPGTGTPEVGGLATWQVQMLLRKLTHLSFVGMDVVEVSPPYDISEITALAAATFVWEYLAILKLGKGLRHDLGHETPPGHHRTTGLHTVVLERE